MKKITAFLLISILLVTGCSQSNSAEGEQSSKEKKVALVLPEKIGVNPFFQQIDEGVKKAGEEEGIEVKTIEASDPGAFEENLRSTVAENYDLIITATYQAEDALTKVANENPDKDFAIIDTVVDLPNVRSALFNEQEAAYLLGAAAGLITEEDKVGMVAADDIPMLKKWSEGFKQGLAKTNPDAEFLINYVGSFTDSAKAKELALLQNSKGADFIAGAAAVGDMGVFEAAKENGFYTAGQDVDRTTIDPEHIVLSQLKSTDVVAYDTVKAFFSGQYDTGVHQYGLKEKGVGLTYVTNETETPLSPYVGEDTVETLKQIKDDIISGEITVENPLAN